MSVSQHELAQQFADDNPEAGSFDEGVVDHEQVKKLTGALQLKLFEISRKNELTPEETQFIQKAADLSARSIQYLVERMGMTIPKSEQAIEHLQRIITATGDIEGSWEHLPSSRQALEHHSELVKLLDTVPAQTVSLRHNPMLRRQFEDYAIANLGGGR